MGTPVATIPPPSPWSEREVEFLGVTLRLLQEHGYDGLTIDEVAAEAKASKATIYRRWPSKADLVVAAFIEGTRSYATLPNTGSLRGDLIAIGHQVCDQAGEHSANVRAVLTEIARTPELGAALQTFFAQRRALITAVLDAAVARGEIDVAVINDDLWDVLPGYLVFRHLLPRTPPSDQTVIDLVDQVMLPSLTRRAV
ncbi:putative HTH-type transcriptional regulator [Mycolicibacterium insubricum]|uniref:TetR family transcriptional regulator n=2 Tax=Mycolicibacterium insubricum TaxID=444597 RepID=A0A1X0DBF3_9MYCO|nr:TetR/AcrR family transcriptional regulator [Mycolicibacterium insubricum]ORA69502.1 TetR family transcriptional regulator [Mycolicibacterium insubricum]BBZ65650.1 putative HTH-type transcriptional regulator [Mycolicibacterium insubricum]